jgi:hypothetical protein
MEANQVASAAASNASSSSSASASQQQTLASVLKSPLFHFSAANAGLYSQKSFIY